MYDNGWFTTGLLYLWIIVSGLFKAIRWCLHVKPILAVLLAFSVGAIAHSYYAHRLDPRIFTPLLFIAIIAFAAVIASMVMPGSTSDPGVEFAPRN